MKKQLRLACLALIGAVTLGSLPGCKPATEPAEPGPVTLRVGDLQSILQSAFVASGQDKGTPYGLEFSNFADGPKIAAALSGKSIEVGLLGDAPIIFAQSAGTPLKAAAVILRNDPTAAALAIVVKPDSPIRTVADLKGRKISFASGTALNYLVFRALSEEGIGMDQVQQVSLPWGSAVSSLANGTIDAAVLPDPILSNALKDKTARILVTGGAPLVREGGYIVVQPDAGQNPRLRAAITDFLVRLGRAEAWLATHPKEAAAAAANVYHVPQDVAELVVRRTPSHLSPITPEVEAYYKSRPITKSRRHSM